MCRLQCISYTVVLTSPSVTFRAITSGLGAGRARAMMGAEICTRCQVHVPGSSRSSHVGQYSRSICGGRGGGRVRLQCFWHITCKITTQGRNLTESWNMLTSIATYPRYLRRHKGFPKCQVDHVQASHGTHTVLSSVPYPAIQTAVIQGASLGICTAQLQNGFQYLTTLHHPYNTLKCPSNCNTCLTCSAHLEAQHLGLRGFQVAHLDTHKVAILETPYYIHEGVQVWR